MSPLDNRLSTKQPDKGSAAKTLHLFIITRACRHEDRETAHLIPKIEGLELQLGNPGFDILSQRSGDVPLRIEVKGRLAGSPDFEITHNEVQMGKNLMPDYRLALVTVDPDDPDRDQVRYIPDPFRGLEFGDFDAKAVVGRWATTWAKGREPW